MSCPAGLALYLTPSPVYALACSALDPAPDLAPSRLPSLQWTPSTQRSGVARISGAKGLNIDVDLTPAQQRERSLKQPRYTALKTQQLSPFWRGSRLMYRSQDGQVREDLGPMPPTTRPATADPGRSYSQAAAPSSGPART